MADGQNETHLVRKENEMNGEPDGDGAQKIGQHVKGLSAKKINTSGNNQVGEGNTQIILDEHMENTMLLNQLRDKLQDKLPDQLREQLLNQLGEQLREQLLNQLPDQFKKTLEIQLEMFCKNLAQVEREFELKLEKL